MSKLSGRVVDLSRKRPMPSIDENKSSRKITARLRIDTRAANVILVTNDELCPSFAIEKSNVLPERTRKFRTRLMRYPYTHVYKFAKLALKNLFWTFLLLGLVKTQFLRKLKSLLSKREITYKFLRGVEYFMSDESNNFLINSSILSICVECLW